MFCFSFPYSHENNTIAPTSVVVAIYCRYRLFWDCSLWVAGLPVIRHSTLSRSSAIDSPTARCSYCALYLSMHSIRERRNSARRFLTFKDLSDRNRFIFCSFWIILLLEYHFVRKYGYLVLIVRREISVDFVNGWNCFKRLKIICDQKMLAIILNTVSI